MPGRARPSGRPTYPGAEDTNLGGPMLHAGTVLALLAAGAAPPLRDPDKYRAIVYVPTPMKVVKKMLELAEVKKSDVVYSLGCGDGRFLVEAAAYGARGVGIDID